LKFFILQQCFDRFSIGKSGIRPALCRNEARHYVVHPKVFDLKLTFARIKRLKLPPATLDKSDQPLFLHQHLLCGKPLPTALN
jgi:hypothetical protein